MTKKELVSALDNYPEDMDVFMAERKTEFTYGLVNSVYLKKINMKESPDDEEVLATQTVLIIDEE